MFFTEHEDAKTQSFFALCAVLGVLVSSCSINNSSQSVILSSRSGNNASSIVVSTVDSAFHSDMLKDTKWEAIDSTGREKRIEMFTDSVMISICEYPKINKTDTTVHYYYLSDFKPSEFDFSKVGKSTYGRYIVLYYNGYTACRQLMWLGLSDMSVKYAEGDDDVKYIRRDVAL